MSEENGDLKSIIQQQLEQREKLREKAHRKPPLTKPGTGPARKEQPVEPPPEPERAPKAKPVPRAERTPPSGYRFLNPYNFVRFLDEPSDEAVGSSPGSRLLSRCEPPPHDRYLGLTGRIACELEAKTPLFISDSQDIRVEKVKDREGRDKEHLSYRFFEYEGQPAIPASSLRGMIRSTFESVTNSCFSVFGGERLSYRLEPGVAATLLPARVETNPKGGWRLRLLPGFAELNAGGRPRVLYAATVRLYDATQPPRSKGRRNGPPPKKVSLKGLEHGARCYALVNKKGIFTYVDEVGRTPEDLDDPWQSTQEIVEGWLCINNQNIEPKSKERIFFRSKENTTDPQFIDLDDPVAMAYEDLIKDYQERHRDAVKKRRDDDLQPDEVLGKGRRAQLAFSRYVYRKEDLTLQEGTLVYARLGRSGRGIRVEQIAPAAVPRVSYHHSIGQLLPDHLHPCDGTLDPAAEKTEKQLLDFKLCPACRVFGWVYGAHQSKGKLPDAKTTAYAGRLRFSHAGLVEGGDKGILEDQILAILSSPKPTTTRFYLRPKNGRPRDGLSNAQVGYDGDNILRGRKVYRHQGKADPAEYLRATGEGFDGRDDQNRTVRGARKPGNRFEFTINFHNLAPVELGALLWALELEEGDQKGHHRLGFGKPLGFGSVALQITDLEIMEPKVRYASLDVDGGWRDGMPDKQECLQAFREAMKAVYGRQLGELENVRDLLALLASEPDLPVHYPRTDREPSVEGKNFEWFVGNKRKHGPKLALAVAEDDHAGLPRIDRMGNPHD